MERVKRRWWTWAVSLIAATVIAGAVLSGAFQLAVLAVPSYREDLAAWVGDVTGRPVQIGGISLSWRGLTPRFDLSGITLYSDDGREELRVERLRLGFALRRLLRGEWVPTRLELSGLRVSLRMDADGSLHIAGFDPADTAATDRRDRWLEGLERFERVLLENCELRVQHAALGASPLTLRLASADLATSANGIALSANLRLPPDRGGALDIEAQFAGPLAQLPALDGRFDVRISELQPQGWLRPWLQPGTQVLAAGLGGRISGEIQAGHVTRARAQLASGGLVLARAGVLSSAREATLVADYLRDPRGWRVDVSDLSFDDDLLLRGTLRHDRLEASSAWDADADHIELTRLAPWIGVWRDTPELLQTVAGSRGEVEGLVLRYRQAEDAAGYTVRARLREVATRTGRRFGFRGLNGEISADENGGRLDLEPTPLTLELPGVMDEDLVLEQLSAPLRWRRDAGGWRFGADPFAARFAGVATQGRFELLLPADEASPQIDLLATLATEDARSASVLIPRHWPDSLKAWLQRAIVAARVPHGDLRIRGPLADFPYHKRRSGSWSLELEVADAELDYAPDWPALKDLRASLSFGGNALEVRGASGRLLGSRIVEAKARIDDFAQQELLIDAQVDGALAQHYAVLRASPLREPLRALLDETRAEGDARVGLRLRIPLDEIDETAVDGEVVLAGASLHYGALQPPIEDLRGRLGFSRDGVHSGEPLQARFAGVPLTLRAEAEAGTAGVIRGDFRYEPQADEGLSPFVPGFVRQALHGASAWRFELPLRQGDSALRLYTDLVGTELRLPSPLTKSADEARPLQLRIGTDDDAPLRLSLDYAERFLLNLRLAKVGEDEITGIDGLRARFGAGEIPPAAAGESLIDGRVDELDLSQWLALFAHDTATEAAQVTQAGLGIRRIDVDSGRLLWAGQSLPATRLRYRALGDGWQADLSGEGAAGVLRWQRNDGGRLSARLQHLRIDQLQLPQSATAAEDASTATADPARWPQLDLISESLSVGEAQLGRAELASARIPDGQRLDRLEFSGGDAQLEASGQWLRRNGQSSAALRLDLKTGSIDKLLDALGYAPNIEARDGHIAAELHWPPAAPGLRWEMATGSIELAFGQGQLRAVKPGASRALALLNFYALPRRLTLDFDDVVGDGLGFDGIKGSFMLGDGVARTQDLRIDGSSLRMDIRGNVGLLARDYDQRVTVYPDVSSGVTLGAVLLGGPAVGALVLLAQELLEKPLEQVTQFSYRITGPWDNPRVERGEAASTPPQ
jgi:uncharacterized protein (TIGR02099 family)